MKSYITKILIAAILTLITTCAFAQSVRVKDIASVEGVRNNQLLGYGIVIGLDGTGDTQQTKFTTQSVASMLNQYGISVSPDKIKLKNVAAVMVSAILPAFARSGSTIDVVVSSLGDSASLKGGTLIQSPLKAANGQVYAVAQGPITVGGFSSGGGGASVSKNHSTVGIVPGGAIIEKETSTNMVTNDILNITLNRNDFTTASRVSTAINDLMGYKVASPKDGNVICVNVPIEYRDDPVSFIARLESVEVKTDTTAKVIVNERTGTVVIGGLVRISPVAVSHGSLTVEINTQTDISQPMPLSDGKTVKTTKKTVEVNEQPASLVQIRGTASIEDLTRALNALHVTPRDLIAILQAIREAGALQAQLEVI